jgi:predicted nucleotidyltransferase
MDYVNSIRHICHALNKNAVNYMIVGGTAVAFYGYGRPSTNSEGDILGKPDVDIWFNPNYENYYRLLDAIEQLGKDVSAYRDEEQPDPRSAFFKLSFDEYTLDLLPRIKAPLPFWSSFKKRAIFQSDGVDISFIPLEGLIQDKEINPRLKDIDDIQHLRRE